MKKKNRREEVRQTSDNKQNEEGREEEGKEKMKESNAGGYEKRGNGEE